MRFDLLRCEILLLVAVLCPVASFVVQSPTQPYRPLFVLTTSPQTFGSSSSPTSGSALYSAAGNEDDPENQEGANLAAELFKFAQDKGIDVSADDLEDDEEDDELEDDDDDEEEFNIPQGAINAFLGYDTGDVGEKLAGNVSLTDDQLYSEMKDRVLDTAGGFVELVGGAKDDDDDDDDITIIMLDQNVVNESRSRQEDAFAWIDSTAPEMEERRRSVLVRELRRVQRASFLHFVLLCLIPTALLIIVIATVAGEDEVCESDATFCELEPRTFMNAFTTRCVCDAIPIDRED
mmetsp:Transcript_10332/g.20919  ORF Transcript_10332/g.20919 Transcript_10332/m.20919 type:complete len:292 (-) Transcript_10332:117-992(-)